MNEQLFTYINSFNAQLGYEVGAIIILLTKEKNKA